MVTRPTVGVTGNAKAWSPSWWCTRLALHLAGATPVRLTVRHAQPDPETLDGLVIGGGDDISPEHYGGDINERVRIDRQRDRLEIDWIQIALQRKIPLLGICRGAQLINVVLGGSLHQDIRPARRLTHNRPGLLPTKQVHLQPDSLVAAICRANHLRVNSLHHQAVNQLGHDLWIAGRDLDQFVQAVECKSGRAIIGVQWHPEYLLYLPSQMALFRWLVRTCAC